MTPQNQSNAITTTTPWWVGHLLQDTATEKFFITGGLGSGKSYGTAIKFHDLVALNSEAKFCWAVAPTHSKVQDILIPTYQEVLFNCYGLMPDKHYRLYLSKPSRIEWIGFKAPTVVFHSADRPELMVGTNISHWMVTEAGLVFETPIVYEKLESRARDNKARCIQGIAEGTPEGFNHFAELANAKEYQWRKKWMATHDAQRFKRINIWTEWNKHLPAGYVDRLKRAYAWNPIKLKSYLYGEFASFTEAACYTNLHAANVRDDLEIDPYLPIVFAWDFNYTPLAWVAWQEQPYKKKNGARGKKIRVIAESDGKSNATDDAVLEFLRKVPPVRFSKTPIRIDGDRSGHSGSHKIRGSDYDIIKSYMTKYYEHVSVIARKEVTPIRASAEQTNKLLLYEVLEVASNCKNTLMSLEKTRYKQGTTDIEKPSDERHTHWQEALRVSLFNHTRDWDLTSDNSPILGLNLGI